jgi:hypothetical protein
VGTSGGDRRPDPGGLDVVEHSGGVGSAGGAAQPLRERKRETHLGTIERLDTEVVHHGRAQERLGLGR